MPRSSIFLENTEEAKWTCDSKINRATLFPSLLETHSSVRIRVLFIGTCFFPYLGEGPTPREVMEHQACTEEWWMNLLYINSLGLSDKLCLAHTWYLSDGFQYYIIAPVFIFFLYRWPIFGGVFLGLGWIGTTVSRIVLVVTELLTVDNFYIPPGCGLVLTL